MKKQTRDRQNARAGAASSTRSDHLRALQRLEAQRTLFEPAARRAVHAALEQAGLNAGAGPVVEIGSGGGQLRRWLPDEVLAAMVHTEREQEFARRFRQAFPEAVVQVASAEALPYATGSVAGVLGLCVLDVVDLESVAAELHRILAPGGCTVQLWDMAPSMRWLCEQQIAQGAVLLPNCCSDPIVRGELPAELQPALPPLDFLNDLVSVPSAHLQGLIALLRPGASGLIDGAALERLAKYLQRFQPRRTGGEVSEVAAEAARALAWLGEDEGEAHAYKRLLLNAWLMLRQARGGNKLPLTLEEISSAQALSDRLAAVFNALGMEVECDVRCARALVPRPAPSNGSTAERLREARFVGRWLGTTAYAAAVPPPGPTVIGPGGMPGPDDLVVEAGVLVMVARKSA